MKSHYEQEKVVLDYQIADINLWIQRRERQETPQY
jgi:hypothetical protein